MSNETNPAGPYTFRESALVQGMYQIADAQGNCVGVLRDLSDAATLYRHLNIAAGQASREQEIADIDEALALVEHEPPVPGMTRADRISNLTPSMGAQSASREHSPDIVERVMEVVNPLVIWDGTSLGPNGGDAEAECRELLTELFKP